MITDYVLHPVAHLAEGHGHPGTVGHGAALHESPALKRRIIFVDVHLHTKEVLAVRATPPGSGWGTVPTPVF